MTPHRLAVVSYHSSPLVAPGSGDAGGMTVYVRALSEALAARGLNTDIYTRAMDDAPPVCVLSPGVRVVSISAGPWRPLDKHELAVHLDEFVGGVRAFARAEGARYDVVHSHYWQSGLAAETLSKLWDLPFVHSHHTLGRVKNRFLAPGDIPEPESRLAGETRVIQAADILIASTDEEWEQMACLYGASHDRLTTLAPGVDHGVFFPGDRRRARASLGVGDELVMLYVGRIQRLKGLELALRAVEQLVPALDRDLLFLVVGGPSGQGGVDECRRLERLTHDLSISSHVRFLGPQPHDRLPTFYRAADVLTVCSHSESFGLAALEAHACATPVVATAVGGLAHIVRDGTSGFLVDTRDPAVFAARLKTLLADDDMRRQFGAAAASHAASFSWDRTADALLDLYSCLVRERAPEICTC